MKYQYRTILNSSRFLMTSRVLSKTHPLSSTKNLLSFNHDDKNYQSVRKFCSSVLKEQSHNTETKTTLDKQKNLEDNNIVGQEIYTVYRLNQEDSCHWSIQEICSCHSTKQKALVACLHYWSFEKLYRRSARVDLKTIPIYLQFIILDYLTLRKDESIEKKESIVNELQELTATHQRPQVESMSEIELEEIIEYLSSLEGGFEMRYGMVFLVMNMNLNSEMHYERYNDEWTYLLD